MIKKICGITNIEDALFSIQQGFDVLGFIFAPSSRKTDIETVKQITAYLPETIKKAGVFLNHSPIEIQNITEYCSLDIIQLHGEEKWDSYKQFSKKFQLMKTVKLKDSIEDKQDLIDRIKLSKKERDFPYFLLEPYIEGAYGGTGKSFQWNILKTIPLENIIVSGGLNCDNINQLLNEHSPYGIDVCSGLEKKPGIKDPVKIQIFMEKVKSYQTKESEA